MDRIFLAADLFMPQVPGPAVQLGATGPATLAGVIVQITAESLMCLTLARHVIEAVGPGGHFLDQTHTLDHFRTELSRSELLCREPYENWKKSGDKDMAQRIQDKLKDILENHSVTELPTKVLSAIEKIRIDGEAELTSKT